MCGITGFASVNDLHNSRSLDQIIGSMVAQLAHRGPDDSGVWIDASAGIALGHRRLAVIDTTADGHQPMCSGSGSHVLIYNGELYNYRLLRAELERSSIIFRSSSDSEVVVEAIEAWGIESALTRFNGMFAFAVWDRVTRTLCLACDRLGEKPVYYGLLNGRTFIFGSELKSLVVHPDFRKDLDFHAFALYLQYGYVPAPHCIY